MEKLYTSSEIAKELWITDRRVLSLAESRHLGQQLADGTWVFTKSDLEAMRKRVVGRPPMYPLKTCIQVLEQLEKDGKINDVSEVKILVRPRKKDIVICKIKSAECGKILYICKA